MRAFSSENHASALDLSVRFIEKRASAREERACQSRRARARLEDTRQSPIGARVGQIDVREDDFRARGGESRIELGLSIRGKENQKARRRRGIRLRRAGRVACLTGARWCALGKER
jgi:hypothetical protein